MMKKVCASSPPASVRSSSVRARTTPFKSIFITTSPRSDGGGFRVDTAAAAAGCAIAPRLRLVALSRALYLPRGARTAVLLAF